MTKLKQPKHGTLYAHLSIAEAKDVWSLASIPLIRFRSVRIKRRDDFIFVLIRGGMWQLFALLT